MADDDDEVGGGWYSFDDITTKAKAKSTIDTYDEKNRRLLKFVAASDEYKSKVDTTMTL